MSLSYIRKTYGVPAYRGATVQYRDVTGVLIYGKITSAKDGRLNIKFAGSKKTWPAPFHPTWNIIYIGKRGEE